MFDDSFLNFLRDEFPEQLGEINTAMNLLIDSIDETAAAVAARGNELSQDKEFKEAAVMMSRAAELQKISQRIKSYTDIFELEEVTLVSEDEAIEDIEKKIPNYSDYEVDVSAVHTLHENFVHKRPHAFELRGRKVYVTKWKEMFLETCNILAEINPDRISRFPDNPRFNGRKSQYFRAKDPGMMRSPLKLDRLDMYVETNFSANDFRNLIIKMIKDYGIPAAEYKIYLRADYTGLHWKKEGADEKAGKEQTDKNKTVAHEESMIIDITGDCMDRVSEHLKKTLVKHTPAIYRTHDRRTTVVCLASRGRDIGERIEYWFGLRIKQREALESGGESYIALGCGSKNRIVLVPFLKFRHRLDDMNTTGKGEGIRHWHIEVVEEQDNYRLRLKAGRPAVDLTEYLLTRNI